MAIMLQQHGFEASFVQEFSRTQSGRVGQVKLLVQKRSQCCILDFLECEIFPIFLFFDLISENSSRRLQSKVVFRFRIGFRVERYSWRLVRVMSKARIDELIMRVSMKISLERIYCESQIRLLWLRVCNLIGFNPGL